MRSVPSTSVTSRIAASGPLPSGAAAESSAVAGPVGFPPQATMPTQHRTSPNLAIQEPSPPTIAPSLPESRRQNRCNLAEFARSHSLDSEIPKGIVERRAAKGQGADARVLTKVTWRDTCDLEVSHVTLHQPLVFTLVPWLACVTPAWLSHSRSPVRGRRQPVRHLIGARGEFVRWQRVICARVREASRWNSSRSGRTRRAALPLREGRFWLGRQVRLLRDTPGDTHVGLDGLFLHEP